MIQELKHEGLQALASRAWAARQNARIHGPTAVGCAVLDSAGGVYIGCNIEHRFRSHDIHAEVNALATMVAEGGEAPVVVFVAAMRESFTPCGACMDWIFELGGPSCAVYFQAGPGGSITSFLAGDLMPHYPR